MERTQGAMSIFERDRTFNQPINRVTSFLMVIFHIGAIAALFMFSWKAVGLALVLLWVAGGLGIGMGYHRLLTHRCYKTPKWVEYVLTVCGTLALEGGPMFWVAVHRLHHQNTDQEGDPHTPRDGGLCAHMGWIMTGQAMHCGSAELLPYVPDLSGLARDIKLLPRVEQSYERKSLVQFGSTQLRTPEVRPNAND